MPCSDKLLPVANGDKIRDLQLDNNSETVILWIHLALNGMPSSNPYLQGSVSLAAEKVERV